ncbi:MAG: hypothetical protein WCI67_05145, partial [Chloroflexales bacterium]
MAMLTTYHLQPPEDRAALSFHFGRQGIGMEEASEALASDSVFAALVAQAVMLDPRNLGGDGGPAFAQPFVGEGSAPPFALSSLLPRLGDLVLLPRPALKLPDMDDAQRERIGKGFKKLRYLSPKLFADVCAGRPLSSEPIIMQKGKVWLSRDEALGLLKNKDLPQPWRRESGEREDAGIARLRETPIWDIDALPHVAVDRVSNASAYYEVGRVTYAPGAGLALLVRFAQPAAQAELERLLGLLGEMVPTAVNIAPVAPEVYEKVGPYLTLAEDLGKMVAQVAHGGVEAIDILTVGGLADVDTKILTTAVLKGMLTVVGADSVNFVNADYFAEQRGITVSETKRFETHDYVSMVIVRATTPGEPVEVAAALVGKKNEPRIVSLFGY